MVRFKNRYFTVEINPLENHASCMEAFPLKDHEIMHSILKITEQIHGEFGAAAIKNGLDVKYCNEHTRIAVIRTRHGPHRLVGSSLPFLSSIGKRKVQIHSIHFGATMVKSFKFLQKYHKEKLNEALQSSKNEGTRLRLQEIMSKIKYMKEMD
nr:EOG090X0GYO [Eurycercus lamellatus]